MRQVRGLSIFIERRGRGCAGAGATASASRGGWFAAHSVTACAPGSARARTTRTSDPTGARFVCFDYSNSKPLHHCRTTRIVDSGEPDRGLIYY